MHPNAELIARFYSAFADQDAAAMGSCYDPSVTFSDPVFPELDYPHVTAMWRMFCSGRSDLTVTFDGVHADDTRGSARWDAQYTFPPTGRPVRNRIKASFGFADGKIVRHEDRFNFYRWARMALGPIGWTLGWTPIVRKQVQQKAGAQLERFMAEERS